MRRTAFFLLTLSLLAVGCEVGALCSAAQAADGSCCCPMMASGMGMEMDMDGSGVPPCMEGTDEVPMPADSEALLDGSGQAWLAVPTTSLAAPHDVPRRLAARAAGPLAAGHGPALYLLGCSFLN